MDRLQTINDATPDSVNQMPAEDFEMISSNKLMVSLLDGLPVMVLVLNTQREVVFSNKAFLSFLEIDSVFPILGLKPGDILGCSSAVAGPDGCGTAKGCRFCGALRAVKQVFEGLSATEECTISGSSSPMLHLRITTEAIQLDDRDFILYSMQDIGHEKKKLLMERIFYHDILNSAHNINSMAELISDKDNAQNHDEYMGLLRRSTSELIDEINTHRILSNGDHANYISKPVEISSFHLYKDLKSEFELLAESGLLISMDKRSENFIFTADRVLLKRVITNMIKNAIEAEQYRGRITIGMMSLNEKGAMIWVHNPSYMTEEIQSQVFNRSFSTKGTDRGLGTYSMKILTERFMKGKISFTSSQTNGTTFIIEIPSKA